MIFRQHGREMHDSFRVRFAVLVIIAWVNSAVAETATLSPLKIGIVGLDTSHSVEFTRLLNSATPPDSFQGCRVVAAYPFGSREIESSARRIPMYTDEVAKMDVEIVGSLKDLLQRVDAVLLETNDGRLHLEQSIQVMKSGKRLFIDKPVAASLADVIAIFAAAEHYQVAVFSASSLRFNPQALAVRSGAIGEVVGCDTFSPCSLEPTHPDLYWYGVHGVESLFTVMRPGCKQVRRIHTLNTDLVVGEWSDGRIGTFRGMRIGAHDYGGIAFGTKGNQLVGENPDYALLLVEIIQFFRSGMPPVSAEETIEIFAFMQAAEVSKQRGGEIVTLESVLDMAQKEADTKRNWR